MNSLSLWTIHVYQELPLLLEWHLEPLLLFLVEGVYHIGNGIVGLYPGVYLTLQPRSLTFALPYPDYQIMVQSTYKYHIDVVISYLRIFICCRMLGLIQF